MAEHPIIFSTDMVVKILTCANCGTITIEIKCPKCGSKDRLKTQTRRIIKPQPDIGSYKGWAESRGIWRNTQSFPGKRWRCPYGQVGDTLWVREALYCDEKGHFGRYKADNKPVGGELPLVWCWKTKHLSGRFMPKIQARIFLEITNIRVVRVQDISGRDARQEGIVPRKDGWCRDDFTQLWDTLNAKRGYGWDKNPFVWVIEFKRVT